LLQKIIPETRRYATAEGEKVAVAQVLSQQLKVAKAGAVVSNFAIGSENGCFIVLTAIENNRATGGTGLIDRLTAYASRSNRIDHVVPKHAPHRKQQNRIGSQRL
jgi:hypothetical protein